VIFEKKALRSSVFVRPPVQVIIKRTGNSEMEVTLAFKGGALQAIDENLKISG
jgi:hypothetical protein